MKILPAMSINKKCFTAISDFWHPNVNEVPKMEHSVCDPTDAATHPLGAEWGRGGGGRVARGAEGGGCKKQLSAIP